MSLIGWLGDAWSRSRVVRVVEGGEDAGPLPGRMVLAELRGSSIATLRSLTTNGRFTGDVCRCPGGPTILLHDDLGEVVAGASIHGFGHVSWNRPRFHNDLIVADPAGLDLLLAAHGVPDQVPLFLGPLTDLLGLHEGHPQFRPAGPAGRRDLAERGVPETLHPVLLSHTGQQSAETSVQQLDDLNSRLMTVTPSPVDRAVILLSWLGRLPVPAEAYWGEGALVRRLLAGITRADIATAAGNTRTGHTAMGVMNLLLHTRDDHTLVTAISPTLRLLFAPNPTTADAG
ncbi:hypothetical protein ACN28G_00265 [Micromonospora sp. WMMA1923]|uniref:hypothetical protein n=1 Tax=Micromonospora sp. WMMA1923 TaxID=3404125 RepID=UPI003B943358